ncbi:sulfatase-like hydrolase/transferase [Brachybacterium saurashtrense]|uniref:Phosphodiesterase n=1 Tax=Brachybacterium saurashtrense TaxID=556288 RepID=A0A345YQT1_9MICO|nr:sulfatase-like hydrolase/transferase [Brachybacterium saurashtrense]AXK46283.1 phosphodiesterase [Brachybacterium saurashtrense]RRR24023.1 phosphodiesterase [Brachybacterium saurashtrense]
MRTTTANENASATTDDDPRPNVLLLVTDDQGAWALGSQMPELHTPALDRLQREGTTLDRFFCASPVCSPARASIATGRMPSAHGVHDWLSPEALARAESPRPPYSPDFLERADGADSLGAMFSRAGYRCGMVGKWHIGSSHTPAPGFEYWWAHQLGGGPYYGAPIWAHDAQTGRPAVPATPAHEPEHLTEAITRQSLDALRRWDESGDQAPFFLQVNWTAPHDPWLDGNHPEELLALYDETDFPSVPRPSAHPWFRSEGMPRAASDRHGALAGYCAAVTGVDRSIAALLAALEVRGELENTIVLFTSDNGFACGHHGYWGKGNGTRPLNVWEPSIRVPFIARWPGRIAAGAVESRPASAVDLYDTLAELTGATPRPDPLRAGRSLAPRLLGTESDEEAAAPIVIHDEYGALRMLRTERFKLVLRREGPTELYDLAEDPGEERNLADEPRHHGTREALRAQLEAWFARREDPALSGWRAEVDGLGQGAPLT